MKRPLVLVSILILLAAASSAPGQYAPTQGPAKDDRSAVQHGAQPNPGEVRPGSRDGDRPSASAGELVPRPGRRILGLPVNTALLVAGAVVVIAAIGALAIPRTRRRAQARGNGTYGRP